MDIRAGSSLLIITYQTSIETYHVNYKLRIISIIIIVKNNIINTHIIIESFFFG